MNDLPIKLILAIDDASGIGNDEKKFGMPWHFKEDLRHFQRVTKNHICVMGRKTFMHLKDLYDDCTLPDRFCVVITRSPEDFLEYESEDTTFSTWGDIASTIEQVSGEYEGIIGIGGAEIYRLFLHSGFHIDTVYVTRVFDIFPTNVKFGDFWSLLKQRMDLGYQYKVLHEEWDLGLSAHQPRFIITQYDFPQEIEFEA